MTNRQHRQDEIDHGATIDSTRLDACHQFMPLSVHRQAALLDRVRNDPCVGIYESLIRQVHIDGDDIDPVKFFEQACEIAAHADAASMQPVLFSTSIKNRDRAEDYVNAHDDADLIYTTPVGWFLDRLELFNPDLSPLNPEFGHLLGYIASIRFMQDTKGEDAVAFIKGAAAESTFRLIEIEAMRHNSHVRTINGDAKSVLYPKSTVQILQDCVDAVLDSQDENDFAVSGNSLSAKFNIKSSGFATIDESTKMQMRRHVVDNYLVPLLRTPK